MPSGAKVAKIVTVHGTFAHVETSSGAGESGSPPQWWQRGGPFEAQIKKLVDSDGSSGEPGSEADFHTFIWNGDNSELSRRKAATRLLAELKTLEAQHEKYCILAHSHGGSVVSAALQEAASKGIKLEGLKRWITVGTPFLELRPERYLFTRLPLLLKALFVASTILLFMYLFYLPGEFFSGRIDFDRQNRLNRLIISTILITLPFIIFYAIAWYFDSKQLFFYRRRNEEKTRKIFGDRWLPLTHEDDEAVRGLAAISSMKLKIFHKNFALPAISLLSVFVLPIAYLWLILSPTAMMSITEFLKTNVYSTQEYKDEMQGVRELFGKLRKVRREIRQLRAEKEDSTQSGENVARSLEIASQIRDLRKQRRKLRRSMIERYPNIVQIQRARIFERRFLKEKQENGAVVPCNPDGQLCGQGRDVLLNANLLFHLVYDEVARWFFDHNYERGLWWLALHFAIPVLLVPLVSGVLAVVIVFIFQALGRVFSSFLSSQLDKQAWFEIRRSALGNDTETEVAVTAAPAPVWIEDSKPFLSNEVGQAVAERSNEEMAASVTRSRAAISEFAVIQQQDGQLSSAINYLTWRELIHTSYFNVSEFQKLVSYAIADTDGFQPSAAFKSDPEFDNVKSWLNSIDKNDDDEDSRGERNESISS